VWAVQLHLRLQSRRKSRGVCANFIGVRTTSAADLLDLNIGVPIYDLVVPSTLSEAVERFRPRFAFKRRRDGMSEHSGLSVPPTLRRSVLTCAVRPTWPEMLIAHFFTHIVSVRRAAHVRFPKHKQHLDALGEIGHWRGDAVAIEAIAEDPVAWRVF
jgi:hypothetical protein